MAELQADADMLQSHNMQPTVIMRRLEVPPSTERLPSTSPSMLPPDTNRAVSPSISTRYHVRCSSVAVATDDTFILVPPKHELCDNTIPNEPVAGCSSMQSSRMNVERAKRDADHTSASVTLTKQTRNHIACSNSNRPSTDMLPSHNMQPTLMLRRLEVPPSTERLPSTSPSMQPWDKKRFSPISISSTESDDSCILVHPEHEHCDNRIPNEPVAGCSSLQSSRMNVERAKRDADHTSASLTKRKRTTRSSHLTLTKQTRNQDACSDDSSSPSTDMLPSHNMQPTLMLRRLEVPPSTERLPSTSPSMQPWDKKRFSPISISSTESDDSCILVHPEHEHCDNRIPNEPVAGCSSLQSSRMNVERAKRDADHTSASLTKRKRTTRSSHLTLTKQTRNQDACSDDSSSPSTDMLPSHNMQPTLMLRRLEVPPSTERLPSTSPSMQPWDKKRFSPISISSTESDDSCILVHPEHEHCDNRIPNEPVAGCSSLQSSRMNVERAKRDADHTSASLTKRKRTTRSSHLTLTKQTRNQDACSDDSSSPSTECSKFGQRYDSDANQSHSEEEREVAGGSNQGSSQTGVSDCEMSETEVMPQPQVNTINNDPRNEGAMINMPRYLDLTGTQSNIIKIVPDTSSSGGHCTYRAILVKRSEAEDLNEVNTIRHDDILGQLVGDIRREPTVRAAVRLLEIASNVQPRPPMTSCSEPEQPAVPVAVTTSTQPAIEERFCGIRRAASSGPEVASSSTHLSPPPQNNNNNFPRRGNAAKQVIPPTFYLTEAEFLDPLAFFDKILPAAAKFGMVKVVPPASFKPDCNLGDDIRFRVINQYLGRMFSRWTPAARELCTIKAYMASRGAHFTTAPLLNGLEINLPRLYHLVQRYGGVRSVNKKNRWTRVASEMPLNQDQAKKLAAIYVKYLQPYETISNDERQKILREVEQAWFIKNQRALDWALNPLHRKRQVLGDSDSSEGELEDDGHVASALAETEDCEVYGRYMKLAHFKKIAEQAVSTHFPHSGLPSIDLLEEEYWRLVLLGTDHVCVNTGKINTRNEGYGFSVDDHDPYGRHPWNMKMIGHSSSNLLGALGEVPGVSVPELNVGMLYSTSCWHRDPHGLPYIDYLHSGPGKLWYGIPDEEGGKFRQAVERLCPTVCQNKPVWLHPHMLMIPPNLLLEQQVSISKLTQLPGEYVIVFPKAYFCSISRGYTLSESVYFATESWLQTSHQAFQEMRESFEPSKFALELILISFARDRCATLSLQQRVHNNLEPIVKEELKYRQLLVDRKITVVDGQSWIWPATAPQRRSRGASVRQQSKCDVCSCSLFFSKVWELIGRKTSLCLRHGLRVLDKKQIKNAQGIIMVSFISDHILRNFVSDLEERLTVLNYSREGLSTI